MALNIAGCLRKMGDPSVVTPKSRHVCAFAVRTFLEAGGMNTGDRPGFAWAYRLWLPRKGFNLIAKLPTRASQTQFTQQHARPGDIAVMPHGLYGHICMWNGRKWVSDFPQNNMWVYSGQGLCLVFRYGGAVVQMPEEPPIDVKSLLNPLNDLVRTVQTSQQARNKFKKPRII